MKSAPRHIPLCLFKSAMLSCVLAIFAVLSACASTQKPAEEPKVDTKALRDAAYGRAAAELHGFGEAATVHKVKYRQWPKSISDFENISDTAFASADAWGIEYAFSESEGSIFEIRSAGEDKVMHTDDDIYWSSRAGVYNPADDPENPMNNR